MHIDAPWLNERGAYFRSQKLVGSTLDDATITAVGAACAEGATPLPETGYQVDLVVATVQETLERLRSTIQKG